MPLTLSPESVALWLREHPEFFDAHAAMLAEIPIPHPHGGRTVSISERQILTLREKNRLLEQKLAELLQFGEENDVIGEKIHRLALALLDQPGPPAGHAGAEGQRLDRLLDVLYGQLREVFQVPHTALRLWDLGVDRPSRPEFAETLPELRAFAHAMVGPYCGHHAVYETNRWFGDAAAHLRSFAAVPLRRDTSTVGLMVLASEDINRFYPEMGTLYLTRLGELTEAGLRTALGDAPPR